MRYDKFAFVGGNLVGSMKLLYTTLTEMDAR